MPIILDDISSMMPAPGAPKSLTPKYFSSELTGAGKAVGLLNQNVHPGRYPLGQSKHTMSTSVVQTKTKSSGSNVTTFTIPTGMLTQYSVEANAALGLLYPVPGQVDRYEVTQHATTLSHDVFLDLVPQGILLTKDENGDAISRDLSILYRMEVHVLAKGSTSETVRHVASAPMRPAASDEWVMMAWSYAPLDDVEELIAEATRPVSPSGNGVYVDVDGLAEWMGEYSVYERLCRLADEWSGDGIADVLSAHIAGLFANGTPSNQVLNHLASQLRYLETYNVSLAAYRPIHTTINGVCPPDIANELSKQNLSLLLSHTLEHLSSMKSQLPSPPQSGTAYQPAPHFSVQQRAAIMADEPLVLTQAGAGTGKSTVILGRIAFLEACGVDPKDITVLSFTNAAADNITARNPMVGSMTIARMIHDIYSLNNPTHELSSIDTILNSLDIFYPQSEFAGAFRRVLMDVDKLAPGSTTMLNAFVEKYAAETKEVLDTIRQTCLELEIVIAYQQIDHMVEPPHVQSKYLIIDEVQDNSIFEFIYLLKYVAKHKENMYIVGDASQTLYEFRASNPKALNALEESGVFATYQLTTNYRSNQEILDFANVHLSDIEANRSAQLKLQANSLAEPTAKSFQEKVTLDYEHYQYVTKFRDDLAGHLSVKVRPYIEACLARGEQVAFLMHARAEVAITEKALQEMFPQENVANLVSERSYPTTVFSQFIKLFWNDILMLDPKDAPMAVGSRIISDLDQLIGKKQNLQKAQGPVTAMIGKWWGESAPSIQGWYGDYTAGRIQEAEFFDNLRQCLLDFEIRHNGIKQSLMNQRNRERKEKNLAAGARLVVSTIHGAKGLEFDNVVVVHKYDAQMSEENKRMFYVAFTRAMNTEFVLSYGANKKSRIQSDYDAIVAALQKRDDLRLLQSQGLDIETMSDDETEAALAALYAETPTEEEGVETKGAAEGSGESGEATAETETSADERELVEDGSAFTGATV